MKKNLISFVYFCCSIIIVKIQLAGAEYELSPKDALSAYGCKESVFVKQKSGIIKYNIDETFTNLCWFITAQTQSNIVISFSYFNIQPQEELYFPPLQGDGNGDCGNYLFVQDASTKLSYVKKSKSNRFCSSFSSSDVFPIVMKTDRVLIQLVARINLSYYQVSGFSLKYSIVEKCQSNLMMERYTVVTSINFPGMYPTISCSWNITSAHTHPIEIVINSFQVRPTSRLLIYDGSNSNSDLLGVWISGNKGDTITTSSNKVFIQFQPGNQTFNPTYTGFNITVKAKGYCVPGTYACGDESCFDEKQRCDGVRDCVSGFDEKGCKGCSADKYWCGGKEWDCYNEAEYCNAYNDCASGGDEKNCNSCTKGAFLCPISRICIYDRWKCDNEFDCHGDDYSDELGCEYTATRRVLTAAIVGSLVCGLLLAVVLGCTCKLYTLRMSSRNRMNRDNPYLQTPLGRIARELLQREAPPSYNMAVEGVEHEVHESSRRSSSRSGRRRSRRRRHRNREPSIRRAQPSEAREERNNREDSNLISGSPSDESTHARGIDEPQPPMTNILRSLGLGETSDAGPSTCRPRDVASTSRSRKDPEQAGPLPSKKKIAPVMVGAPCGGEMTADIAGCVYPNPPTYREAVGGEEVEVLAPHVVEVDHVGAVEDAGRRRFWRNGNFWRSPLSYFRTSRTFQQLHDNDSTSMESMSVDMVSLGGNEQSTSGATHPHATPSNPPNPASPTEVWTSPVQINIPQLRVEGSEQLLTLNISGSIPERT